MTEDPIPLSDDPPLEPISSLVPIDEPDDPQLPTFEPSGTIDPVLEAFRSLGERVDRRFNELQGLFEREVRAEATREKVVDRLHAELQESKQDLLLNALRPIFVDLIQLHDDIGKVAVIPPESDDATRRFIGLLSGFQQGIEDILYRQGVEPFENEGPLFDPRRQRAITTVVTEDPDMNKTIAARLRKGFISREKVIRAEIVSVYATKR